MCCNIVGLDRIPSQLLKNIIQSLDTSFNLSLKRGIVPSEWKEAHVTTLFKKVTKSNSENYRPVKIL